MLIKKEKLAVDQIHHKEKLSKLVIQKSIKSNEKIQSTEIRNEKRIPKIGNLNVKIPSTKIRNKLVIQKSIKSDEKIQSTEIRNEKRIPKVDNLSVKIPSTETRNEE